VRRPSAPRLAIASCAPASSTRAYGISDKSTSVKSTHPPELLPRERGLLVCCVRNVDFLKDYACFTRCAYRKFHRLPIAGRDLRSKSPGLNQPSCGDHRSPPEPFRHESIGDPTESPGSARQGLRGPVLSLGQPGLEANVLKLKAWLAKRLRRF
jgi:hypothetical protein